MRQDNDKALPIGGMIAAGAGIAITAILLFGGLWLGLGLLGASDAARLVAAVCAPPAILTVVVLAIYLKRRDLIDGS
jgi:hypothetical protein